MEHRTILSMHFEKCGGTTLRYFWKKAFDEKEFFLYEPHIPQHQSSIEGISRGDRKVSVIHGHYQYGLHEKIGTPCDYVCVFRDPVDRFISHFNHWREWGQAPEGSGISGSKMTIEEFLDSKYCETIRNLMTKRLAGIPLGTPASADDFVKAKANLSTFAAVGSLHYLGNFGEELQRKFNLSTGNANFRLNSQGRGTVRIKLPQAVIDKISLLNYWDTQIAQE